MIITSFYSVWSCSSNGYAGLGNSKDDRFNRPQSSLDGSSIQRVPIFPRLSRFYQSARENIDSRGEVAERSKAVARKGCYTAKARIGGSNPSPLRLLLGMRG